jgi:glycosyltransferase involved in cell wall biosynthesis
VPTEDPDALREALGAWLRDEGLRAHLRRAARQRRTALPGWDATARDLAAVLITAGDLPATEPGRA